MSNWGFRPEFRERELRKAVDLVSRELIRQLGHGLADPDLSNFITKSTRALTRKVHRKITKTGGESGPGKKETSEAQGSRVSVLP